jgi:hypothetical protein
MSVTCLARCHHPAENDIYHEAVPALHEAVPARFLKEHGRVSAVMLELVGGGRSVCLIAAILVLRTNCGCFGLHDQQQSGCCVL